MLVERWFSMFVNLECIKYSIMYEARLGVKEVWVVFDGFSYICECLFPNNL